jgi:hypothetical protein
VPLSTAFPTWLNDQTPGASDLNRLQDNDRFFAARPILSLGRSVDQRVENATVTPIAWNADTADPEAMHAAGASDIVVTVPGWYHVTCTVGWTVPTNPTGYRSVRLTRNDVQFTRDDRAAVSLIGTFQTASRLWSFAVGDVLRADAVQAQGGPLNIAGGELSSPSLDMIWIRSL